jgi:epoxyqueuosine reductase
MPVDVSTELERAGFRGRRVSIPRLRELRDEIEGRHREGLFDEAVYETYLAHFGYDPPDGLPEPRSLIVVASPQPALRFTFVWKGRSFRLAVPPTYFHGTDDQAREALTGALGPAGYGVAPAPVPKKLLAVRSGLAAYGKNNVTYVPGLGSFYRIAAFYSDLPCPEDDWREPAMLERCRECDLCRRACPAGAIGEDRFLLHAERCITFHNEQPPEVPFPAWLEPRWHDRCLVGCLRCQRSCPENEGVRGWVEEGEAFSAEETELLVAGVPLEQFPPETAAKIERANLAPFLSLLPRNLEVIFARTAGNDG